MAGISGTSVKAGVDGFMGGVNFGLGLEDRQDRKARQTRLDDERAADKKYNRGINERNFGIQQSNRAEDLDHRDKVFEQNKQLIDLNGELKQLQISSAGDKLTRERGSYISKAMRAAMTGRDGERLTPEEFQAFDPEEVQRRFGVLNEGMAWMSNEGNFLKGYLGKNPSGSINADKPVAGFSLMQSNQGNLGVGAHLNLNDGSTGMLDYPNRADGEGSVIPADAFVDMAWQTSGVFLDDKMTDREKLGVQNKHATELESLKSKNRMAEQSAKPQTKTDMQRNMEYLIESGVSKNPAQARKMMLQAKSNPSKIIAEMVKSSEENQMMFNIKPGDERYRNREQMITEAFGLLDKINGKTSQPGVDDVQPTGQQEDGGVVDHSTQRVASQSQTTTPSQQQSGLPPKESLVPGQVYEIPGRGKAQWNGTMFTPVAE